MGKDKKSGRAGRTAVRVISRGWFDGAYSEVLKSAEEFASKQIPDPFITSYHGTGTDATSEAYLNPLPPPYNPDLLERVAQINNTLPQCIAAMVTNCELTGHSFVYTGEKGEEQNEEALAEKKFAESFMLRPNGMDSMRAIRRKLRHDFETLGYWYMEVGRTQTGDVSWFDHLPGKFCRLCGLDPEEVETKRWVLREGEYTQITVKRRFRRFVQLVGARKVFFKEYGDPRKIDPKTGRVNDALSFADSATEVIHHCIYPIEGYGLPRWTNNIPAALGSRECELVNLQFFKDNMIPALAVLVSGGYLTQETIDDLQANFGAYKGRDSMNRVLVIEARPDEESVGDVSSTPPVPSLSIQPLGANRQSDELFTGYDQANQEKIRSSFRLPPIFIGRSQDYTYATAQASVDVTERQVFGPEKQDFDDIVNTRLLMRNGQPLKYWQFRSNVSKVTDANLIMQVLQNLMQYGGGSANLCIQTMRELYDANIPLIEDEWGDAPWIIVNALVAQGALEVSPQTQNALEGVQKAIEKFRKAASPVKDTGQGGDEEEEKPVRVRSRKKPKAKAQDEEDEE